MRAPFALRTMVLTLFLGVGGVAYTQDCNVNGVPDATDLALGTSDDCDGNLVPDECDITAGALDSNLNGIPDSCEPVGAALPIPTGGYASVSSVSISGDSAVVGSSAATSSAGAAHVFRRVGTIWVEQGSALVASDAAAGDLFGASVAIDGDVIAIGAPGADIGATVDAGAVYIFRRAAGVWTQEDKRTLPTPVADDQLGAAVSVRGVRILAGAPRTGASGTETGQGVIYFHNGTNWTDEAALTPTVADGDRFGYAVQLAPTHAFVAAPGRTSGATANAGEVNVYELSGTWSLAATLADATPQSGAFFGGSVAGTDVSVAIGAPDQDTLAGAVHVFEKAGAIWSSSQELTSPAVTPSERFGVAVGMSTTFLLVGESETTGTTTGMAHVYTRGAGTWVFDATLCEGLLGDLFGEGVSTDGLFGVVAAPGLPGTSVHWVNTIPDCNSNGIDDACDISSGLEADCNLNGIPDSCDGIVDTIDPVITNVPANITVNNSPGLCANTSISWTPPTVSDNCQVATFTSTHTPGQSFNFGTSTVTYTATDTSGNQSSVSFLVTVNDIESPFYPTTPANITTSNDAGACGANVSWTAPVAIDNCAVFTFSSTHTPGNFFPIGTTTVTYNSSDFVGNLASTSFTVTVNDTELPVISGNPGTLVVNSTGGTCGATVTLPVLTATDNCSVPTPTPDIATGSIFAVGATLVTYTATDVNGNSETATLTVTVNDATLPVLVGMPTNITVSANPLLCSATASWTPPTATDDCGGTTIVGSHVPGATFPVGTTTVTYTATDGAANSAVASFTVTVTDDQDPTWTFVPTNITTIAAPGLCGTNVTWTAPTPNDNCGVSSTTESHLTGAFFPVGTTSVDYTATDAAGNVGSASFLITVGETEPPVIVGLPSPIIVSSTAGTCGTVVSWTAPTATDNCGVASLIPNVASGAFFPVGLNSVTYTATDVNGNVTIQSFAVTVNDATTPTLTGTPANITVPATAGQCTAAVSWTPPTGADDCTLQGVTTTHSPGSIFPLGATLVTYTATDAAGNSTSTSFTVTVNDVAPPTISGPPSDLTVGNDAGNCSAVVSWTPPTAADTCSATMLTSNFSPGATFVVGSTLVTYTATDASGNSSIASFTVTVDDVEAPAVSAPPANIVLSAAPGVCAQIATWTPPTASDNCGVSSFTPNFPPNSSFSVGVTTVIYTATDAGGNSTAVTFNVTITDDELPQISGTPANISVFSSPGTCAATVAWTAPTASDNCSVPTFTSNFTPGTSFPVGVTTVTYTATDPAGNSNSTNFSVTVTDAELPVIAGVPAPIIVNTGPTNCAATVTWSAPTASDNCSVVSFAPNVASGSSFSVGVTVVIYTAFDPSGNSNTASFTVTVIDAQSPVIAGAPANITITAEPGFCARAVSWTVPTATDNCSVQNFTSNFSPGASFPVGITAVIYSATDPSGNTTNASFTVTVTDDEFPVISGVPAPISISALAGSCAAPVTWVEPTASDNCAVANFTPNFPSGATFAVGTTTVTYTATDSAGNIETQSFAVTVTDDQAPVISSAPANISTSAAAGSCAALVSWTAPTAIDNCTLSGIAPDILPGTSFPVGITTVTYTATDAAGNSSLATFDVTVNDTQAPVISGNPGDQSVTTPAGQSTAVVSWTEPSATDNCTLASLIPDLPSGSTFIVGVTQVTYVATDIAGNTSQISFNVSVTDNEAPVISGVPADITQTADPGVCSTAVTWVAPTATDNTIVVSFGPDFLPGSTFPLGVTTVTYTAVDDSANSSTASFDVIVTDNELPVISGTPANINLTVSSGACTQPATWTPPTATDNCSVASLTPSFPPGTPFPVGVTPVVYTATDGSGNTSQTSFTVTVFDLEMPVITSVPANITLSAALGTCAASATWIPPIASDNCTVSSFTSSSASGSSFPVGTTTVTYTATDASGNVSLASFSVTVTDNQQPIITNLPANISVSADPGTCATTVLWTAPAATDNCSLSSFTANAVSGSTFSVGVTPVTYTATDAAGNFRTATFVISVVDTEDPVIAGLPGNIATSATPGTCTAPALWATPTATDNCAIASFSSNLTSGSIFPAGVTPVTYIAIDTAGNITSGTFLVTVFDNEAPTLSGVPADITVPASAGACSAVVTWVEPTATDTCGTTTLSTNRPSGSTFAVGTTTVTYTATDGANVTIATFSVTVVDLAPPSISGLPLNFSVSAAAGGCAATVNWSQPGAADNCSLASLTSDFVSGATFPIGTTTVTYTATDSAGNIANASFDFTVTDDEDPVLLGVPANVVVLTSGGLCTAPAAWTAPTATDNCGSAIVNSNFSPGATFPLGVTPVVYTATDAGGNTRIASFTVTVLDGDPPTLSGMPSTTTSPTNSGLCGAVVTWTQPTATDACSPTTVSSDIPSGSIFPLGTTTVTYTASDGLNSTTATFDVLVFDGQAPTITNIPADILLTATAGTCSATAVWIPPLAADNCFLASLIPNFPSGATFSLGTNTVTYTATDAAGNISTASFFVVVSDNQPPVLTAVPSSITVFTTGGLCSAVATWTPPVPTDNCGPAGLSTNFAPGTSFPVGAHTVTYTSNDPSGNSTAASFTVTVIDGDAPVISGVPADITVGNNIGACGAVVSWASPTATDACASASVTADIPSGSFFPLGTTTVTITATDGGNSSTATFDVTVNDTQSPTIAALPAPITIPAGPGVCSAAVSWTAPTATDNCAMGTLIPDLAPGSTFFLGTTTVTYTATDGAGNSSTGSFPVTVIDTQPPQLSGVPGNVTAFTTGGLCSAPATWTAPTAVDNCGAASVVGSLTPGTSFPVGVTTVSYTATDSAGNIASASFSVTVIDGDAPVISGVPGNIFATNDLGLCSAVVLWTTPTATDACGTVTLTSDFANGSAFPVGTTAVTYTATDGGNSSTATFDVIVSDDQNPVIIGLPAPIVLFALPGSCAAPAIWVAPTATDNCAVASLTPSIPSGSSFPVGVTSVTYTATDTGGNTTTGAFTVTVVDTEDPVISGLPTDQIASASPGVGSAIVTWAAPTATDNCSIPTLLADFTSGASFPIGVTTVTYTATDAAGNITTASFTVTVSDNESPVISGTPANISVSAAPGTCSTIVSWTEPTASDNGVLVSFTSTHLPGETFSVGSTTVTYSALDDSFNVTTASFLVTVTDDESPVFTGTPAPISISAAPGTCANSVSWTPPVATDNCALAGVISNLLPGASLPVGVTAVTYTATDTAGNATPTSFTVTVTDNQLPVISGIPSNIIVSTSGGLCTAGASWVAPVAFDNCGIQSLSANATSGDAFPVGVNTVTYTATDVNGNIRIASFTVTVVDGDAPVISGMPTDILASNSPGICGATVSWAAPTATDACGVATLTSTFASGATFPVGTTLVTYTASDGANSSSASFLVTVTDNAGPTITGLPSALIVPVQTGLCAAAVTWTAPVAADNCSVASLIFDHAPGSLYPVGTTPVIYLATDSSGNSTSATFNITVIDNQIPTISGIPGNISLTTSGGLCTALATWSAPTAIDNCNLASLTSNFPSGSAFPVGVSTVIYTALDTAGNSASSSFTVSVNDGDAPQFSGIPANIVANAALGTCSRIVTWTPPIAADACGVAIVTASHSPGSSFNVGVTTVTYSASDGVNSSQVSFSVTVVDTQPPTIVGLPTNVVAPATVGGCSAPVFWTPPLAIDNCGLATIIPNLVPGSIFPLGNTPVTYIASDSGGNNTFGTFIVTVVDAQPPQILGTPSNITVSAAVGTCSQNVSWAAPTATDICGPANLSASIPPGASFPAGTTTVNYTATDLAGNSTTSSFTVTVIDQNPPALIGLPGSQVLTVTPGACLAVALWSEPIAIDPCGGVTVTSDFNSGTAFPIGTTAVTYTATDLSGNTTTGIFGITVVDNTGPNVSGVPTDIFVSVSPGACSNSVTWLVPTFTDGCGIATQSQSHTPGQVFPLGTTTVIYSASDPSGNTTVATFAVTVSDFTGPTFQGMPADIVIPNTTGQCSAIVTWTVPTVSDPCGVASVSSNFSPGAVLAAGVTTVTYTAVDNNGNISTASFTITIQDQISPVLVNVPADMTVPVAPGFCGTVPIWTEPLPVDNCGILSLTSNFSPGAFFPLGTTTVTYTATDLNNNSVTASFDITVVDVLPPLFAGVPANIVQVLTPGGCSEVVGWIEPTASDPCGLLSLVGDLAPGSTLSAGTTTVTYTATDVNGNVDSASFLITIIDPEVPTLTGVPADISVNNDLGACSAVVTWTPPVAADNCAVVTFTGDANPGDSFPVGATVVTYSATDPSGNVTSGSFTVTVTDTELPTIPNLPASVSVNTSNNQCQANVNWPAPVGADNCGVATLTGTHSPGTIFPVGNTVVTYTITDIHGNVAIINMIVSVIDDDPPTITGLPLVLNVQSSPGTCGATVSWPNPITADNCSVVSLTSTHQPGSLFPIGTTIVTYTATDPSGNLGFRNLTITVVDNQPPVIAGGPGNISVTNNPGQCYATVSWVPPTATDNCGILSFTSTHNPGDLFPIGQTPVTYTATDVNNVVQQLNFLVTVSDAELPILSIGGGHRRLRSPGGVHFHDQRADPHRERQLQPDQCHQRLQRLR